MLLTLQCCGQDTDGLREALGMAIARSEVCKSFNCISMIYILL